MLTIPEAVWQELLDRLAAAPPGVERVAYLDGVMLLGRADQRHSVATTVTIPHARLTPGNYQVSADAMSDAGAHLAEHRLRRLAQIHTHGGTDTRHSRTDDDMAYSHLPGSISIVLPFHAAHRPHPLEGSVHVRGDDGWQCLDAAAASATLRVVPSVIDRRPPSQVPAHDAYPTRRWIRRWWKRSMTGTPAI